MKKIIAIILATMIIVAFALPTYAQAEPIYMYAMYEGKLIRIGPIFSMGGVLTGARSLTATCYISHYGASGTYREYRYGTHGNYNSSWGEFIWSDSYKTYNNHEHTGSFTATNVTLEGGEYTCCNSPSAVDMHCYDYSATADISGIFTCYP